MMLIYSAYYLIHKSYYHPIVFHVSLDIDAACLNVSYNYEFSANR